MGHVTLHKKVFNEGRGVVHISKTTKCLKDSTSSFKDLKENIEKMTKTYAQHPLTCSSGDYKMINMSFERFVKLDSRYSLPCDSKTCPSFHTKCAMFNGQFPSCVNFQAFYSKFCPLKLLKVDLPKLGQI